ncbi:ABC transporter substrate-binding protein [Pseudactinotalea sp. HY160]|uniref:ABC transporter substrate-binding protein n=1 Tax=Pseudactinotalea sp. HY160 TaxID=2654490 RepID=UPI00128BC09A|nr:ABC transporter substrate-binding protein [Pseudactinotalea sp. HY160]MPV49319.1 ABC transporter substrate-binding protein [Pseudactinotalea sp. HY160]
MVTIRRSIVGTTLLTLGALALAACGAGGGGAADGASGAGSPPGQGGGGADTPVTIGLTYVPNIQFAPWYVAEEAGYFTDAGVEVTLRHHGQDEDLFGALAAGVEQVVVSAGDEILQARSQGVDVVDFATVYQDYPVRLVVPADSPIHTLADLRGASIGIPGRYGQSWFGLLAALEQAGLTEHDVTIAEIGFTQQTALSAGRVDAVVGFVNNDVPKFRSAGLAVRVLDQDPVPLVGVGMGAAGAMIESEPAALAGILTAVHRAVQDIVADPQVAIDAAREHIPGTITPDQEEAMRRSIEATIPLYGDVDAAAWGTPEVGRWQGMADFMSAQGLLEGAVSPGEAVTDEIAANQ